MLAVTDRSLEVFTSALNIPICFLGDARKLVSTLRRVLVGDVESSIGMLYNRPHIRSARTNIVAIKALRIEMRNKIEEKIRELESLSVEEEEKLVASYHALKDRLSLQWEGFFQELTKQGFSASRVRAVALATFFVYTQKKSLGISSEDALFIACSKGIARSVIRFSDLPKEVIEAGDFSSFTCVISQNVMTDPVYLRVSSRNQPLEHYERAVLEEWMEKNPTDPFTRAKIRGRQIHADFDLQWRIERSVNAVLFPSGPEEVLTYEEEDLKEQALLFLSAISVCERVKDVYEMTVQESGSFFSAMRAAEEEAMRSMQFIHPILVSIKEMWALQISSSQVGKLVKIGAAIFSQGGSKEEVLSTVEQQASCFLEEASSLAGASRNSTRPHEFFAVSQNVLDCIQDRAKQIPGSEVISLLYSKDKRKFGFKKRDFPPKTQLVEVPLEFDASKTVMRIPREERLLELNFKVDGGYLRRRGAIQTDLQTSDPFKIRKF